MQEAKSTDISTSGKWIGPLLILAAALVLRLVYLYQISGNPFFYHPIIDAWDYHADAVQMVGTGDWIGDRAFFQAPLATYLYAVIYRVAGVNLLWPRIVQAMMGALTAAGVFLLGRRLFSERAAWVAGAAAACYPLFIFFEGELLAPAVTLLLDVCLLLVVFGVTAPRAGLLWPVSGFLLGLRALATTNILAAVPLFWVWILIKERSWSRPRRRQLVSLVLFSVGIAAAVFPVTLRNWELHRQVVLVSSNAGVNFYLGNSGDYDAKVAIRDGADWEDFVKEHVRAARRAGPDLSGYFFMEARKYIATHPLEYLRLLLYKTYLFINGNEIMRNQAIYPFREYSTVLGVLMWKVHVPGKPGLAFPLGVLLPLAWPGCLLAVKARHREGLFLLAFGVVYSLSVIAFFVTARYRLPIVIPAILLMAYGWTGIRQWWSSGGLRAIALAGMVALALISNWNVGPMSSQMNSDAYYYLAGTLVEQGDLEGAEKSYKKALEMNPEDVGAWVNIGLNVYEEKGLLEQAELCYRQALKLRPGYATPVFNLGVLADRRNRPARAESLYLEAARRDPLMAEPYINLASLALSRGAFKDAQRYYREAYARDPENAKALVGLGVTTFELEGLHPALGFFEEAIRMEPGFPDIYFNLSLVYARSGEHRKAADYARRTIELDPADNDAYLLYADQMRSAGAVEEARAFLEEAIRRTPDLPGPKEARDRLGG